MKEVGRLGSRSVEEWLVKFQKNQGNRFVDLSGAFEKDMLLACSREIAGWLAEIPREKDIYGSFNKYRESRFEEMPPACQQLVRYLNGAEFLETLSRITGIQNLLPDPDLQGGGIHAIGTGGFLKLHTDFNWHAKLQAHRRLNLIVYLCENWSAEWGGEIEIWNEDATEKIYAMQPVIGNVLLFATTDKSYHGHPDPLECPPDRYRMSMAMYYYTKDRPVDELVFGKSEMTNYVERPGESFESDKTRRLVHKLRLMLKKLREIMARK